MPRGEGLDYVLLEMPTARVMRADLVALPRGEALIGDAEYVPLDAGRDQRHWRPHMPGNARRRVQRDRRPDILDVALADAVASEEIPRRIGAVDLEAQNRGWAAMGLHQTQVMEHGADIGAARDHRPSPCVPQ